MCLPDTGVLDEHKKKQVIDFPADLELEGIEQHYKTTCWAVEAGAVGSNACADLHASC